MAEGGYIPTQRFLDVNYEPEQRLPPVHGYELKPLVSLEEAVRPLESIITNIQNFVRRAVENCQQTKDGLIPNERAAIYLYTMNCLYSQLNIALRNEDRDKLKPYFSYLKLFLTALWKLSDVNGTVWRGVKMNLSDQYPNGKKFIWWGLSSCTTSLDILQKNTFLGEIGPRTLFNIQCFNGKSIGNHSKYPSESEILLLPCSHFEVMGRIKQGSDLHIIHLQQIVPPVLLIQPPFEIKISTNNNINSNEIQAMTNNFNQMQLLESATTTFETWAFDLNILKQKPNLSIKISIASSRMFANDMYLLYDSKHKLYLMDVQGNKKFKIKVGFQMSDSCWSSLLNQFFVLNGSMRRLYSLDLSVSKKQELKQIKEFNQDMWSCTCYGNKFLVTTGSKGSIIEEYNILNWDLRRTFKSPISCSDYQEIWNIRFNSNGLRLGVILSQKVHPTRPFWFELRNSNDMQILQVTDLGGDNWAWLLSLPNQQFLAITWIEKKFFLINSDGQIKQTLDYALESIRSAALINKYCLVIQTQDPDVLRFYHLSL